MRSPTYSSASTSNESPSRPSATSFRHSASRCARSPSISLVSRARASSSVRPGDQPRERGRDPVEPALIALALLDEPRAHDVAVRDQQRHHALARDAHEAELREAQALAVERETEAELTGDLA